MKIFKSEEEAIKELTIHPEKYRELDKKFCPIIISTCVGSQCICYRGPAINYTDNSRDHWYISYAYCHNVMNSGSIKISQSIGE